MGDTTRRVISYDRVVQAGRRHFAERRTIDMEALAEELAVSRATLYRVAGSRDRLLGDVLWTFAETFFRHSREEADSTGAERLLEVLRRFSERIFAAEEFRAFLADDAETAVRVLFTPAGQIHERFVAVNRELIQDTVNSGELTIRFDVDILAYVWVRLYESMWYGDLLSGRRPDQNLVEHLARALLTGDPAGSAAISQPRRRGGPRAR